MTTPEQPRAEHGQRGALVAAFRRNEVVNRASDRTLWEPEWAVASDDEAERMADVALAALAATAGTPVPAPDVWVSGSPNGPWMKASEIECPPQSDDEMFAWVDRLLATMDAAAVPMLTLTYRDDQDRRCRMHLGNGQLRRLVELARPAADLAPTAKTSPTDRCCERMASHLAKTCDDHDRYACPDVVMERFDTEPAVYGIPVHDGGSSIIEIVFCPWCGTRLSGPARGSDSGEA